MLVQQRAAHAYDFLQNEAPGVRKAELKLTAGKDESPRPISLGQILIRW